MGHKSFLSNDRSKDLGANNYAKDISRLSVVREVRDHHSDAARPPASTVVPVEAPARPDFLLEVEAWAVVP